MNVFFVYIIAFYLFLLLPISKSFGVPDLDLTIEDHYRKGREFSDRSDYSQALLELNQAMGRLRHLPNHLLRKKVEDLINQTKQDIAMERNRKAARTFLNDDDADELLPLESEPEHFRVLQTYGKVFVRKVWEGRDQIESGEFIGSGRQISILPNAGLEIEESGDLQYILRLSDGVGVTLVSVDTLKVHSGYFSFCSSKKLDGFSLLFGNSNLMISTTQAFACFGEVGVDGSLQFSSLLGRIQLHLEDSEKVLLPGQRIYAKGIKSHKMSDLELNSNYLHSRLKRKFETYPIFFSQLNQQARLQMQARRFY